MSLESLKVGVLESKTLGVGILGTSVFGGEGLITGGLSPSSCVMTGFQPT